MACALIYAWEPVDGVSDKIRASRDICDIGNRDHEITEFFSTFCSSVSLTASKISRILLALNYMQYDRSAYSYVR